MLLLAREAWGVGWLSDDQPVVITAQLAQPAGQGDIRPHTLSQPPRPFAGKSPPPSSSFSAF